jgi:hypothetical protein
MWKKVTGWAAGILALGAVFTAVIGLTSAGPLQTDEEASKWQDQHVLTEAEKFKADRIDRVQRENDRIEFQLLDPLPVEKVTFLKRQIEKNDKKIECIRAETC